MSDFVISFYTSLVLVYYPRLDSSTLFYPSENPPGKANQQIDQAPSYRTC